MKKQLKKALCGAMAAGMMLGATTSVQAEDPLKIGIIYLTMEHAYYQAHAQHTRDYCEELGIELVELDGQVDQAVMAEQIENLIVQNVDGIIYCPIEGGAASADINVVQDAGIPILTFAISHNQETANAPFVGLDEFAAGSLGGVEAAKLFNEKFSDKEAKIGIIENTADPASVNRSDGFISGFQSVISEAEVVSRVNGEAVKDTAASVTEDLIQAHPEINVFFGANGDQGLGALAALESSGRGTLDTEIVVSHDGSEAEVIKIVDPNSALKVANANKPKECARACVDTLLEMINGEREMTNTDNIVVETAVVTGDDLEAVQEFLTVEYCSDLILE